MANLEVLITPLPNRAKKRALYFLKRARAITLALNHCKFCNQRVSSIERKRAIHCLWVTDTILKGLVLDLQHAWTVKTLEFGWLDALHPQQMGHSLEVHNRTYPRWISLRHHQRVYDLLVNRPDRPRPPGGV